MPPSLSLHDALPISEAGANVAIHYNSDSTRPEAERTLAAVEAAGVKGAMLQGDLTVPANVERLFADAEAAIGQVDVAVNTVGKVLRKPIVETDRKSTRLNSVTWPARMPSSA